MQEKGSEKGEQGPLDNPALSTMQPPKHNWRFQDTGHVGESLSVMIQKEQTIYVSRDYLDCPSIANVNTTTMIFTESDRLEIVNWCYNVVDQLEFDRENVAMAMELVDRFLSTPSDLTCTILCDRSQLQLLALTAICIYIKANDKIALGSEFYAILSQGKFSMSDVKGMELSILMGLSWRIFAPTSIQIAYHMLSLTMPHVNLCEPTWEDILDEVQVQCELAVRDYYFVTQRRSTIALAAIFNALDQVGHQDRQAILCSMHRVTSKVLDSPELLQSIKDAILEEGGPIFSDSLSVEAEAACSLKRQSEQSERQKASKRSMVMPLNGYCGMVMRRKFPSSA